MLSLIDLLHVLPTRAKPDADRSNLKTSKYLLIKRSLAFDKSKKDMGDMKGVVKSVETHNDRFIVSTESGEKLELKVIFLSLLQVF